MSNVIQALVSVVNGVVGDPPLPGLDRARLAAPAASGGGGTPGRVRAASVIPLRHRTRPAAALTVLAAAVIGSAALLRRRYLRWGASNDEQHRALAGDDLLPAADQSTTRSIRIAPTAEDVWPWIAQLGQG
ncbi:MAG: hypothetical protein ABJD68_17310 [Nakamurella sp.]